MKSKGLFAGAGALAMLMAAGTAAADEIELPGTLIWTAYNLGTGGYNQAVAIGSVLKNRHNVNLRVMPGKNDVSRLSPLTSGRAQFSATGSDSIYAQEAVFVFGTREWGPQSIRYVTQNIGDGCSVSFAVAGDLGVETIQDLKGKRVAWVRGAPALNLAVESMLAHAGLGWDDVQRVEVSGFGESIDGIIAGQHDAANTATNSAFMVKMAAGPRGLYHPPQPHADDAGWERLNRVVPWYVRHHCRDGAGVPPGGYEGVTTPYPILVSMADTSDDLVYNMAKAMFVHYDEYKEMAPGLNGWKWESQRPANSYIPYHPGAIRYYQEAGKWTSEAQANTDRQLQRQQTIQDAWAGYARGAPADASAFAKGWMEARAAALTAAGFDTVFDSW